MPRILITDGEQRSSLAAVRSLGSAGHHVVVCSKRPKPLAGASRFCAGAFQVPDASEAPAAYAAEVARLLDSERIDVLLPMTDESAPLLVPVAASRQALHTPFPPRDAYEWVSDKVKLCDLARTLGVPVPTSLVLDEPPSGPAHSDEAIHGFLGRVPLPLVVKPGRSAVTTDGGVLRFGVSLVSTRDELDSVLRDLDRAAYPVMLQETILGPGLGAFLLFDHGRPVARFAHRRLREKPPTGGVSVYRESVAPRSDVIEPASRLLEHVGWHGVAMVEFKEDAETGVPFLMEVNGRFWGSLQLAIDAGVDFPRLILEPPGPGAAPLGPARLGIRSRWLLGDLDHLIAILRSPRGYRRHRPDLPGRLAALGRFLLPWRPGDRFEVLRARDPGPFFRELGAWLRRE